MRTTVKGDCGPKTQPAGEMKDNPASATRSARVRGYATVNSGNRAVRQSVRKLRGLTAC